MIHAVWSAGGSARNISTAALKNIKRLILRNPNVSDARLQEYATRFGAFNLDEVRTAVKTLTGRAEQAGVEVRWHDDPSVSVVINREPGNEWARVEWLLPHVESHLRPNTRMFQRRQPQAFHVIQEMYDALWSAARVPSACQQVALPDASRLPLATAGVPALIPTGRPVQRQLPSSSDVEHSDKPPIPDGEIRIEEVRKKPHLAFKVHNLRAEPKQNYLMRVVDVQLWSDDIEGSGGFGPWREFRNYGKPIDLKEQGGHPGSIDFHTPKLFELIIPGANQWHIAIHKGSAQAMNLQDGDWWFVLEFHWGGGISKWSAFAKLSSKKGREKSAEFLDASPSGPR